MTFLRKEGFLRTITKIMKALWYEHLYATTAIFRLKTEDFSLESTLAESNIEANRISRHSDNRAAFTHEYAMKFASYRSIEAVKRFVDVRLDQGAELWTFIVNGRIANTQWAIRGKYIEPFYYPLSDEDAVLFDAFTFEEFRRKGINPKGLVHMINCLRREGVKNIIVMIKVWNKASIQSTLKAPFEKIGVARKFNIFGKSLVFWFDM